MDCTYSSISAEDKTHAIIKTYSCKEINYTAASILPDHDSPVLEFSPPELQIKRDLRFAPLLV